MKTEDENYNRIIRVLRNSRPEAGTTNDIVNEVIARIATGKEDDNFFPRFIDFLFGWVYIGWVRRSLVAVSFILVGLFVWQQNRILNQISLLRSQVRMNRETAYDPSFSLEKKLAIRRMSGIGSGFISNKETNIVPDSLMEIRSKYRDLIKLIEEDPELRRMIEKKLNNSTVGKFNTKIIKPNV
jgi:hypothetical protein